MTLIKIDDLIVKEFVKCVIAHDNGEINIYLGISKNNGSASNWLPRACRTPLIVGDIIIFQIVKI